MSKEDPRTHENAIHAEHDQIVLLTPEDAEKAKVELSQDRLTQTGKNVLRLLAAAIAKNGNRAFNFGVDNEHPNSPGYGLESEDISIIITLASKSRWLIEITPHSVSNEQTKWSWWTISAKPLTN